MPDEVNENLPASVRNHLPPHAQDIFRAAFDHAWIEYGDRADQEGTAMRVAWAAVKRRYHNQGDRWVPNRD